MSKVFPTGKYRLPKKASQRRHWGDLPGSAQSLVITQTLVENPDFSLVIVEDSHAAEQAFNELRFFLPEDIPVL
ncbi:MAG TPA: hypothetical protein QF611_14235, partial [Pseudomonadales bacterium]|nr:hypothetical protein [Pseudomonadales bacterium]